MLGSDHTISFIKCNDTDSTMSYCPYISWVLTCQFLLVKNVLFLSNSNKNKHCTCQASDSVFRVHMYDIRDILSSDILLFFLSIRSKTLQMSEEICQPVSLFFASGALFFRDNTHFQFRFSATRCHLVEGWGSKIFPFPPFPFGKCH